MDGVIVIDKPQGLTSHDVVAVARRVLRETRIGHTGTLDPLATGVLPLACGRATRLARFLSASDKEYDATVRFGLTTDSYDVTGAETSRSGAAPSREAVETALESFRGDYLQMPPPYSAKKIAGRRAYELARRDEVVTLAAVPVRVARLELLSFDGSTCSVRLTCSAGFYVRSLAHGLGERVGTGACLEALRRTRSGGFGLDRAAPLDRLQSQPETALEGFIPLDALLPGFPSVTVTAEGRVRISRGQGTFTTANISTPVPHGESEWVRIEDESGALVALGTPGSAPGSLHPKVVLIG